MPKIKTHPPSPKPFKNTPSPNLKPSHPYTTHLFPNKSQNQNRNLPNTTLLTPPHF
ncbi:50S ribosomal protein L35, partial [Bacillus subtilis]|uniref:50S ribosomal protein L35 n=1 Tax=Bacillus subtilis TaxID=1423 RepID=UPI0011A838AE